MTVEEAIKKAEKQLQQFDYIAETTCYKGIAAINREKAQWLSIILHHARTAVRDREERENPKRLTTEELAMMNAPVWCACKTLEGTDGFWCLCQKGFIISPSGGCFKAKEIPHWELYRFPPKGE